MATVLADGGRAVETAVSQVLPQLSHAVKVAFEAVAAGSSSCVLDVERRLSLQLDEAVANLKAHNDAGLSAVPELLGSTAAEVRYLRAKVAHLRSLSGTQTGADTSRRGSDRDAGGGLVWVAGAVGGREGAGGRVGEWGGDDHVSGVATAVCFPSGSPLPAIGLGATAAAAQGCLPAVPAVVQCPAAAPPAAAAAQPPLVSSPLVQDRANVRQLAMRHKLENVPISSGDGQYWPLLPLEKDLGWAAALEEYALGFMGRGATRRRASLWEVEAKFGDRWCFCVPEAADRWRLGKLHSARSPIYRASQVEYAKRGAAIAVAKVVSVLKAKYKGRGGAIAVYMLASQDYPASKK